MFDLRRPMPSYTEIVGEGSCAVDIWCRLVAAVVYAPHDVRTLASWAALLHASPIAIRQRCYAANVRPSCSLRLARLLRAVMQAQGATWDVSEWFVVADVRTLRSLLAGTRLVARGGAVPRVSEFLAHQCVVDPVHPGVRALADAFERHHDTRGPGPVPD